jgi:hypothetical protein
MLLSYGYLTPCQWSLCAIIFCTQYSAKSDSLYLRFISHGDFSTTRALVLRHQVLKRAQCGIGAGTGGNYDLLVM